jgi:hypothetical protein
VISGWGIQARGLANRTERRTARQSARASLVTTQLVLAALATLVWLPRSAAQNSPPLPLAVKLAPILLFHPGEQHFPDSASAYLKMSSLHWRDAGSRCADALFETRGAINPRRLGSGNYFRTRQASIECKRPYRQGFRSSDLTRPFDSRSATGDDGFYLSHAGSNRGGSEPWPVYVQYKPDRWLTYWFFYAFSRPYKVGAIPKPLRSLFGRHQGDWEQIAIRLEGGQPTEVAYYAHGSPRIVPWSKATDGGERPLVAVALGSHGSYPPSFAPPSGEQRETVFRLLGGRVEVVDILSRAGRPWFTSQRMRDVLREPWYGYGGAWGRPGKWWGPERVDDRRDVTTGPLGPSRWKPPVPPEWAD